MAHPLRLAGILLSLPLVTHADEGMWLFNKPPVRQVKEKYGFEITPEWLEHLQKSSVRFGSGGSGSFASADGLILTNHHVGSGMIEKLSTPERDLLKDGFYAKTADEELKCPNLELNVLMSIEDVTTRVNAAVTADQSPEEAAAARRAVIAKIEKESLDATGFRSDVVTLFQGGAYHLYRYQRYTDVRLVFAPDAQAAAFGGDPDNFEYPRYCLDCCFFRPYQDGKPVHVEHFLKWNPEGAKEGELVFVSGHPGRTNRSNTYAELKAMRDDSLPYRMEQIYRNEVVLDAWGSRDKENTRRAKGGIVGIRNGRKATQARLEGLLDPSFMAGKAKAEASLREAFHGREEWHGADAAFDRIAEIETRAVENSMRGRMLEAGDAFSSSLFKIAKTLLRAGDEATKPDAERLREFQENGRVSLELGLFSGEPIYRNMEIVKLTNSLTFLCSKLGIEDPVVAAIMAGKSPHDRATELVTGSHLADVALRRELYKGGKEAVAASKDPMIELARLIDPEARVLRTKSEAENEEVSQAHEKIATARFALEGDTTYPDATFSLRLSYGVVKGYQDGPTTIPAETTLGGLFERAKAQENVPPFNLPVTWEKAKAKVDLKKPFNFVSTNDITGGNSGSPVVNQKGELVGLIFDSNEPGLILNFGYSEVSGRAVSVHTAGMLEALKNIYGAKRVLDEIVN